jgi:hypothetical protein
LVQQYVDGVLGKNEIVPALVQMGMDEEDAENMFLDWEDQLMHNGRPVDYGKAPVRSGVNGGGWDEIPEKAVEDHGDYRVYKGGLVIERNGNGSWEWTGPGFSFAGTTYPTAGEAWDEGVSMRKQGRLKKGLSGHDGPPLSQYDDSRGYYVGSGRAPVRSAAEGQKVSRLGFKSSRTGAVQSGSENV